MSVLDYFYIADLFILGLIVGSFLNAVIYRTHKGKSLKGRSFCPHCKKQLKVYDLIPLFSYIFRFGKCRFCKKPISAQYPLVEFATGLIFAGLYVTFLPSNIYELISLGFLLVLSAFLIVIFVYDLYHKLILNRFVYPAVLVAIAWLAYRNGIMGDLEDLTAVWFGVDNNLLISTSFLSYVVAGFGAFLFFLSLVLISKGRWMGGGDVRFALLMGLILGAPYTLLALFVAFTTGSVVGMVLIVAHKSSFKSEVPFGPFLVFGTFVAIFFGSPLVNGYLSLIGIS